MPGRESGTLWLIDGSAYARLARRGQHRPPSVPGLLVAATAELSGLVVLHVDKDFDLIAEVTGQPVERLAM